MGVLAHRLRMLDRLLIFWGWHPDILVTLKPMQWRMSGFFLKMKHDSMMQHMLGLSSFIVLWNRTWYGLGFGGRKPSNYNSDN